MSSMLPIMFREMIRPMRMMEQHMRLMQEELMHPHHFPSIARWPLLDRRADTDLKTDNSVVSSDKEKFQIKMDVQNFSPEEIKVKMADGNSVIVEAKHEERADEKGFISRQLVRRFLIPEGHNLKEICSKLSSDGVLTITAPKNPEAMEREIPIAHTGPEKIQEAKPTKE